MMIRLIGCWPNKHTQVRKPRETGFERQTWKRRDFPVNLATANSFHGDKLIRLSANDSFLVQTRLRANTSTDISFPIYMYIYIDAISTADAFNRVDISSFGFHGRVKIADRRREGREFDSFSSKKRQVIGLEKSI